MSMNPGHTTAPWRSIVLWAGSAMSPTATIPSPTSPTSATTAGAPEPSTTLPPRSSTSYTSGLAQELIHGRLDHGSLEEVGIGSGIKAHRVGEGEFGEGVLIDPA